MSDQSKRLIEIAFPLKQASLDSVHEKNVRHGHISTLHIWPARRPLAASRAALIATLLPDPGDPQERQRILEKLGGKIVQRLRRKKGADGQTVEEVKEETEGGILHWGRESGPDLDWFRQKIREAYGGRAPKVLDPFAGGGSIPLEAMRLGCEVTAVDINPVAWFILKCTLEYPQKLAGQKRPLPDFVLQDREFMESFLKAQGFKGKALALEMEKLGFGKAVEQHLPGLETAGINLEADLAWHVRAWGRWVLAQARRDLARFYPTYADFEPLVEVSHAWERRPMRLVPLKEDGTPDVGALNAEFSPEYLADRRNPRWVAKPTVAYLWARSVTCKNCRAVIPLLKTRWLCKKDKKRVVLTMRPKSPSDQGTGDKVVGVVFGIEYNVPIVGSTQALRNSHDKQVGNGTISRSGVACPCCHVIMTREDLQQEGLMGGIGEILTTVVVDGPKGKEYRLPTEHDFQPALVLKEEIKQVFSQVPYCLPTEKLTIDAKGNTWCTLYGMDSFDKLFTHRQLIAIGSFINYIRETKSTLKKYYTIEWIEAIYVYLTCVLSKLLDYGNSLCSWYAKNEQISHLFNRFVLPFKWDFAETSPIGGASGSWESMLHSVEKSVATAVSLPGNMYMPSVLLESAINLNEQAIDFIITDPPYYDAIGYSVLMDFFYVWLRRSLDGLNDESLQAFYQPLTPKWDHKEDNGELVDDANRFGGDKNKSRLVYENGMFHAFLACNKALQTDGRLVVVFANKQPEAWEALVSALIRANFVVNGSWPIQTEMSNRTRAHAGAALASSVWLVCKKRPETSRPGWDNRVLEEMHLNIAARLRDFWDAGIRGPDFVWAATGPALEAYSQYPVVKKTNHPGEVMGVSEFLTHVRRIVVDFVVGRVLSGSGEQESSGLDSISTYYLLHRHDFGLQEAPAGACILYAISCGLSDRDLADRYQILTASGKVKSPEDLDENFDEDSEEAYEESSKSTMRLKGWKERKRYLLKGDGEGVAPSRLPLFPDLEAAVPESRAVPLVDHVHRLMHLWKGGDVNRVNDYLDGHGLRRNQLSHQVLQALIELAPANSEERSLLESISNHVGAKALNAQRLF